MPEIRLDRKYERYLDYRKKFEDRQIFVQNQSLIVIEREKNIVTEAIELINQGKLKKDICSKFHICDETLRKYIKKYEASLNV